MNLKLTFGMLTFASAVFLLTASGIAQAQTNEDSTDLKTHTATGCLQKNAVTNTYTITDENGKLWDLRSDTVSLNAHVENTVTVSGTIPQPPKNSTDTSPQNHLLVTKLDMVRNSCKQP
jgi:hypothetical protein